MSVDQNGKPAGKPIERRDFIKNAALGMSAMAIGMVALGCSSSSSSTALGTTQPSNKPFTFAVVTDIHILDGILLGDSGSYYTNYIESDPKMLDMSPQTVDVAFAAIMQHTPTPSFVLIPGDLTKDGEYVDHLVVAGKLSVLASAGIPVYVVPGNHDINNPAAVSYLDPATTSLGAPVPNISPAQFKSIYGPYGYNNALYQDPNSLSYIAEPVAGLWLFAIDSCEYQSNPALGTGEPVTNGKISASTLAWLQTYLAAAKSLGKVVIGMEHHLLMEHFVGQESFFQAYILDNYTTVTPALAAAGLGLVFTGHFHANSVAYNGNSQAPLWDVSTGSTVITPCPFRFVTANLAAKTFNITTSTVKSIPEYPNPTTVGSTMGWSEYEYGFLMTNMPFVATGMLTQLGVPSALLTGLQLPFAFSVSMGAFYAGNPTITDTTNPNYTDYYAPTNTIIQEMLAFSGGTTQQNALVQQLGAAINQIWKPNRTIDDNNLTITL
ncbi:MAG: metallophosphoesterase [Holophaga sp.]|nr:metallophosphoesterase [Holophaga sp.]